MSPLLIDVVVSVLASFFLFIFMDELFMAPIRASDSHVNQMDWESQHQNHEANDLQRQK
jgi:hypothetical protein